MEWKSLINEALVKGGSLKEVLAGEVLNSRAVKELLQSDLFARAVTSVLRTKEDVKRAIRQNAKVVLELMDVPSRGDMVQLERQVERLEKNLDRVGKRAITVKSLRRIKQRSDTRAMSKTSRGKRK